MSDGHEPLDVTLQRLREERDRADRAYNDALTALDRVVVRPVGLPEPPPAYDEQQVTPLNEAVNVLVTPPPMSGVKGRLAAFVWRLVAPTLERQATFNSIVVQHVNRNVGVHRATQERVAATIAALQRHVDDLGAFRAQLMLYLQQITGYVDTKDRDSAGKALVLNSILNGVASDQAMRAESTRARQQRVEAQVAALGDTIEELRTVAGISQQAALTVKRELERLISSSPRDPEVRGTREPLSSNVLDSYKYVEFENQFRGSREAISERLASYLPYFEGARDVLDVGCGRGEFLALLKGRHIPARGLDLNHEMVEVCRAAGHDVTEADVVSYLEGVPDGSLGGLFAAQVVEHLEPGYLLRFLELAHHKLRSGAPIVLETLNPACWVAFFESYIRDITHRWPLHPETLRYLVLASGFTAARIEYRSPVPPQDRLQAAAVAGGDHLADLVETFNGNVEKLNARLFTFLDYAIVGTNA